MYTEDIYTAAAAICGEESEFLRLLCTAAEEELTYRLKSDISPGDIEEIFIAAASLLAVSMFKGTSSGADGIKSFSAGEMSVTYFGGEGTDSSGGSLRETAELLIARYVDDDGFAFRGI